MSIILQTTLTYIGNTIMCFDGEGFAAAGLFGFGLIIAGLSIFMACLDWINKVTVTNIGSTILLITIILYVVVGFYGMCKDWW